MENSEETLFEAALKLEDPRQRAAFLDAACQGQPDLRRRLEALLAAQPEADAFFQKRLQPDPTTAAMPLTEKAGDRIGRYKLLQQIGEGGCGVVYMAEQEAPVQRRVALKVIKLGMDTKQVIARFEAERQALALMDHPNIARVFDAGATETGRPFFVMELVRGIKITDYCDRNNLTTRERLDLFIQVCHAVQHAHQKGIIHRDIKPSNILVTINDGMRVPKVIDFGIAKATGQQRLTDKTLFTAFEQFIGTPAYMSPEQAEMTSLDIDTRSDIYALGVLLYELLTGKTPIDAKELLAAGLDEMRRTIRDKEPVRPSTRLRTMLEGERTTTAHHRRTEAPKLIHLLRGDLDWIVMKCLEKDRTRRYETAHGLAVDIERHLAHQPVSAAAPTLRYRTMKYVRRHRRVLATAAAFALVLIFGATFSVWQAQRADRASRERASLRKVKWALETALPEIERYLQDDDKAAAFKLVEQARTSVADNPRFQALAARAESVISVETTPPGAEVFIRDYSDRDPKWEPIGKSPLKGARLAQGAKRWKVTLPQYEIAEGALVSGPEPVELKVHLEKAGTTAPGMVRIAGAECNASLCLLDWRSLPVLKLADFLIDRYEVSNLRFREFVEAGGYQKPEYWKHKFVQDGRELDWSAAMKLFVDQSGRPGPATWVDGNFPKGHEQYPVGGVSWYEAAAYAQWAGKHLPTVYHWGLAAGDTMWTEVAFISPLSNFGGEGPAPVGTYQGMTCRGVYDMAGNVKEWCFNETQDSWRVTAGGAWNEAQCTFGGADRKPPFSREANFGFRCMKLLSDEGIWTQTASPLRLSPPLALGNPKPCSDEVFQAYTRLYDYKRSELQPTIDATEAISPYVRWERVSFSAAYGKERVTAHLFVPRAGKPPFQTLVIFGVALSSAIAPLPPNTLDSLARSHRAVVMPVLRGRWPEGAPPLEDSICWAKDFKRTLDYFETRPEVFDTNRLAFLGASWGAIWGGILPAIEPRIKVAILGAGGFIPGYPPECNTVNFAPRIKIPILMQGGNYDTYFPIESSQKPYLALFGTAESDKCHKVYETGHYIWNGNRWIKDMLEFMDRYLGPANGGTYATALTGDMDARGNGK